MNRTRIEGVVNADGSQGFAWNPFVGCSNGCSYCWARKCLSGQAPFARTMVVSVPLATRAQAAVWMQDHCQDVRLTHPGPQYFLDFVRWREGSEGSRVRGFEGN